MEEKEVEVQEFGGKHYFIYNTVLMNNTKYVIFVSIEDETDILVAKETNEVYEIIDEEERDELLSLYKEKGE